MQAPEDQSHRTWPPSLWQELWTESRSGSSYWITRFLIIRLLGLVYLVAFSTLVDQGPGLIGPDGLLPVEQHLAQIQRSLGSRWSGFLRYPSIFWLGSSEVWLLSIGWIGVLLSTVVLLGYANGSMLLVLWMLHLSVVHVGQTWYSFGWEIQLLETGFLAVFLCPFLDGRPFPRRPPPVLVVWMYRWLIFRIMLGAGLIKIRGDECWRDLTCLYHHYETQPIPHPLSPVLHFMPRWFHEVGVAFTHFVELVVPFFAFGPRIARNVAGGLFVALQVILIASGNLAYLNWLTIVPALACFDDALLAKLMPDRVRAWVDAARARAETTRTQRVAVGLLTLVVATLSVRPVGNLLSKRQVMNTSFDRLHLVNTYGAFGSIGQVRHEIVFEGTTDEEITEQTRWRPFEFECKPGDVQRRPCLITPYHQRLDWLMWFAAMGDPMNYPWTVHLAWKMLEDEPAVYDLLADDPFPDATPAHVRARFYRYEFAPLGQEHWWRRKLLGTWLPPVSADDPRLHRSLQLYGWGPQSSGPSR